MVYLAHPDILGIAPPVECQCLQVSHATGIDGGVVQIVSQAQHCHLHWAQVLDEIMKLAAAFIGLQHSVEGSSFEAVSALSHLSLALHSSVHLASMPQPLSVFA